MVNKVTQSPGDEGLQGKSTRDRLFRAMWIYLRGCVVVFVLFLVVKVIGEAYTRIAAWLEPQSEWTNSSASSGILTVAILVFGPWIMGKVVEIFLTGKLFQKQRGVRAFQQMDRKLTTELKADQHRGYRVALVNWPNPNTRTLGLVVADFTEPETGRDLAAVYLPGTPDPTKGAMRVVATEDLTLTDWGLSDLTRFHITFGSGSHDLSDTVE